MRFAAWQHSQLISFRRPSSGHPEIPNEFRVWIIFTFFQVKEKSPQKYCSSRSAKLKDIWVETNQPPFLVGGWFPNPSEKKWSSNWVHLPQGSGLKIKHILKPSPRFCYWIPPSSSPFPPVKSHGSAQWEYLDLKINGENTKGGSEKLQPSGGILGISRIWC